MTVSVLDYLKVDYVSHYFKLTMYLKIVSGKLSLFFAVRNCHKLVDYDNSNLLS